MCPFSRTATLVSDTIVHVFIFTSSKSCAIFLIHLKVSFFKTSVSSVWNIFCPSVCLRRKLSGSVKLQ